MADLKQTAGKIFHDTLAAIDIAATTARKLDRAGSRIRCGERVVDLAEFCEIRAVAFGKAAYAMVNGLRAVLEPEFHATGVISAPTPAPYRLPEFQTFLSGHPVPNEESLAAGEAILKMLSGCDERTLVFFLLSGGGSALVERPLFEDVTLDDVKALNRLLVTCGAPIDDMNAVRKHLSAVKGGRLAATAPRATKITLGVSDVPAGRESALASGPTIPDPTTVEHACRVVKQYHLLPRLPAAIRYRFENPEALPETPKTGDAAFERSWFGLLLDVHDLFHQAHRSAEAAGFVTICDNATDDWPLAKAADHLLGVLAELKRAHAPRPVCVIADGEVSSPVTGDGIGGRNSAFVLDCVEKIAGKRIAVLSAGTDGVDGNSPAAGAVADGETLQRARAAKLDPRDSFRRSDACTFFQKLGDAIETGPTGNNLRDLRIFLAE
jgi:hydroxypyruvate reductase